MMKITEDRLRYLVEEEGITDVDVLAEHFHVWPRSVERAMLRYQMRTSARPYRLSQQQVDRIRLLWREGVFTRWIAEDVGVNVSTVRDFTRDLRPLETRGDDWSTVWQEIRRNPTLLALHREFTPQQRMPEMGIAERGVAA